MPTTVDEAEIVRRAQGGDQEAAGLILRKWRRKVEQIARRYSEDCSRVEFDDLVQAGWSGFWDAIRMYDATRGFRIQTYAITAAKNRIIKECRSSSKVMDRRTHRGFHISDDFSVSPACNADPSVPAERRETIATINACLLRLTPRQREAVRLVVFEGLTLEEAGREMGIRNQSVSGLKELALRKLGEMDELVGLAS
jgi:RNA polymerase sigma factor (sigma-70 family)